ncbi:MAG: GNAT family N-acetyltransferase [Nocardiopsaceae bacterium]|nr:GNAT family N-acetyltransferase [Nocardiopsaceae bacterium]
MDLQVKHVPLNMRYEAVDGDRVAGSVMYTPSDGVLVLTHTKVDPSYEGQGVGGTLVRGALDDVRSRGLAVVPRCPFVQGWINRHPEYVDLVRPDTAGGE